MLMASLIFWSLIKERHRTRFIIIASFVGLSLIQWKFTLFLIALILAVFLTVKIIQKNLSLSLMVLSVTTISIILITFKYLGNIFPLLLARENPLSQNYIVPLGISYLIFKLIAFILDVYRGNIPNPDLEELLAFILFIPIFPAGPIERYQNFVGSRQSTFDTAFYIKGLQRIAIGYFKKVVIVNFILYEIIYKNYFPLVSSNGVSLNLPAGLILFFLIGSLIYAYIDLSAYADIAIGFGQLFGYTICENMNFPIFQKNLSDYWNCWHISLSHWCRNNVYFPVLGQTRNNTLALYSSFIVMGLWHNLTLNWLLWGAWHATGIAIFSKWNRYKRKNKKLFRRIPAFIGSAVGISLTMTYAGLGFAFIMMENTVEALRLLFALIV
jgi:alginate O-acetyltransferase complex protein AlgI